jgi:hypothetical protein
MDILNLFSLDIPISQVTPNECIGKIFRNENKVFSVINNLEDIIKSNSFFKAVPQNIFATSKRPILVFDYFIDCTDERNPLLKRRVSEASYKNLTKNNQSPEELYKMLGFYPFYAEDLKDYPEFQRVEASNWGYNFIDAIIPDEVLNRIIDKQSLKSFRVKCEDVQIIDKVNYLKDENNKLIFVEHIS